MNKEPNKKCIICGADYYECSLCEKVRSYTPWRVVCDDFSHYEIYVLIKGNREGLFDAEELKAEYNRLKSRVDFTKLLPDVQAELNKIAAIVQNNKKVK